MAQLNSQRQNLLDYILNGMDEDEFQRGIQLGEKVLGFRSYDAFVQAQRTVLAASDDTTISTLEILKNSLIPLFHIMDKEDMVDWEAEGFAFNSKNKIVIYHSR